MADEGEEMTAEKFLATQRRLTQIAAAFMAAREREDQAAVEVLLDEFGGCFPTRYGFVLLCDALLHNQSALEGRSVEDILKQMVMELAIQSA